MADKHYANRYFSVHTAEEIVNGVPVSKMFEFFKMSILAICSTGDDNRDDADRD